MNASLLSVARHLIATALVLATAFLGAASPAFAGTMPDEYYYINAKPLSWGSYVEEETGETQCFMEVGSITMNSTPGTRPKNTTSVQLPTKFPSIFLHGPMEMCGAVTDAKNRGFNSQGNPGAQYVPTLTFFLYVNGGQYAAPYFIPGKGVYSYYEILGVFSGE